VSIKWSDKEIDFLLNNCGVMSNKNIAKSLNRSYHAVTHKLWEKGISVFNNFYSAKLLGKELNRNHVTIMDWYRKGFIKGKEAEWKMGYMNRSMIFTEDNIVSFLRNFYFKFNWRDIPNLYFRNIVKECYEQRENGTDDDQ
jgi:hypothetical protein